MRQSSVVKSGGSLSSHLLPRSCISGVLLLSASPFDSNQMSRCLCVSGLEAALAFVSAGIGLAVLLLCLELVLLTAVFCGVSGPDTLPKEPVVLR